MADFPTTRVIGGIAPDDQIGQTSADRAYIFKGTTAYWDPPNAPVPLARTPAGMIGASGGNRGPQQLRSLADPTGAFANTQFGRGGAGLTLSGEVNRRALPAEEKQIGGAVENPTVRGGLAMGPGVEWFEQIVIFPTELALGNVLSTQVKTIELYNAYRRPRIDVDWDSFVNNVGTGVAVTNLPGLPFAIPATESFIADVQISTAGPPSISGTLDFGFGPPQSTITPVPVTGNRITIFQYIPQAPIRESLEFKTDILRNNDGTEQRIKVRNSPRQKIKFTVRTDDDITRDRINSVLFDWQARVFGLPIWWEQRPLGGDVTIGGTTIVVDTADADYRDNSLVMVWQDNLIFEVLEIDSFTANDITTKTPFAKGFTAGFAQVLPVRTALTKPQLSNSRFAIGPSDFQMEWEVLDNVDLASLGPFNTYMGVGQTVAKPILDGFNFMPGGTVGEGNRRRVERLDTDVGPPTQFSPWAKSKPLYQFGMEAKGFDEVWDWRELMHYVRGSQLSFYVPTGRRDFKPIGDIPDTSTFIDVELFGFTNFVQEVTPRSDLRFVRNDGTSSVHQIVSSVEQSEFVERISFTPQISPALALADLDRIEFVTLCRMDGDKVEFRHQRPGESRLQFNLIGVPA